MRIHSVVLILIKDSFASTLIIVAVVVAVVFVADSDRNTQKVTSTDVVGITQYVTGMYTEYVEYT